MINSIDIHICLTGIASFVVFLAIHFVTFRFIRADFLLKALMFNFIAGLLLGVGLGVGVFGIHAIVHILLFVLIYGLAAFFYVLCIFGPFETSIRMRLIREIAEDKNGKTYEQIKQGYNEGIILDNRLDRLLGAGDIHFVNGKYVFHKNQNAFFILDKIAGILHAFIYKN